MIVDPWNATYVLWEFTQACVYIPGEFSCSKDVSGDMRITIVPDPGFYFARETASMIEPGVCTTGPTGQQDCVITGITDDLAVRGAFLPLSP